MAKHNVDYAFKSYVLKEHSDLVDKTKKASRLGFVIDKSFEDGDFTLAFRLKEKGFQETNDLWSECLDKNLTREFKECKKINHASFERRRRLQNRVSKILLSGDCLFLTLTFTDDALVNTTEKERRIAVTRYLKQYNCMYIANIDFGKENHREHYHALIQCTKVDYSKWNYGAINGEKIRNRDISTDSVKLAKYISKLTNHAIKETTKRSCLIYSRQ